jgi:hypothetical protein
MGNELGGLQHRTCSWLAPGAAINTLYPQAETTNGRIDSPTDGQHSITVREL